MSKRLNMSNDEAVEWLLSLKNLDICGENRKTAIDKAIQALEAQPKTGYISIDVKKLAKEVAEKALDEITYEGKTIREWAEILAKQQPCEDCISRQAVIDAINFEDEWLFDAKSHNADTNIAFSAIKSKISELPSITPRRDLAETSQDCISRAEVRRILGNEVFELTKLHTVNPEDNPKADAMAYGVNWSLNTLMELPSVIPQTTCEDAVSREAVQDLISRWLSDYLLDETREALETINYKIGDMPSVTPQRPKGKWIEIEIDAGECIYKCTKCGMRVINPYKYCPICGSYNGGGEDG